MGAGVAGVDCPIVYGRLLHAGGRNVQLAGEPHTNDRRRQSVARS
jgi:hypothetical protein